MSDDEKKQSEQTQDDLQDVKPDPRLRNYLEGDVEPDPKLRNIVYKEKENST